MPQVKTEATDGYSAVQVGYNQTNVPGKVNKPELGHLAKSGAPQLRTLQEFRVRARPARCQPVRAARPGHTPARRTCSLRMARACALSGLHASIAPCSQRWPHCACLAVALVPRLWR